MIYIQNDKINVQGYQKLIKVNEKEMIFLYKNKTITITGDNLIIEYFESDEFLMKGTINCINFL